LPKDFEDMRTEYYQALGQPEKAEEFITTLRQQMIDALTSFDQAVPKLSSQIRILDKKGGWISLTPLTTQPEPHNLRRLKAEISKRWGVTSLLPHFTRHPQRAFVCKKDAAYAEGSGSLHIFQAVDQLILPSQARANRFAGARRRHCPGIPCRVRAGEETNLDLVRAGQARHCPNLVIRHKHDAASLRDAVYCELIGACFLQNGGERSRPLGAGNLDPVLRAIGEAFRAVGECMEVSRGESQAFKKAARGIHQRPSPFRR